MIYMYITDSGDKNVIVQRQTLQVQKYMDSYMVPLQSIGLGVSDEPVGSESC